MQSIREYRNGICYSIFYQQVSSKFYTLQFVGTILTFLSECFFAGWDVNFFTIAELARRCLAPANSTWKLNVMHSAVWQHVLKPVFCRRALRWTENVKVTADWSHLKQAHPAHFIDKTWLLLGNVANKTTIFLWRAFCFLLFGYHFSVLFLDI